MGWLKKKEISPFDSFKCFTTIKDCFSSREHIELIVKSVSVNWLRCSPHSNKLRIKQHRQIKREVCGLTATIVVLKAREERGGDGHRLRGWHGKTVCRERK